MSTSNIPSSSAGKDDTSTSSPASQSVATTTRVERAERKNPGGRTIFTNTSSVEALMSAPAKPSVVIVPGVNREEPKQPSREETTENVSGFEEAAIFNPLTHSVATTPDETEADRQKPAGDRISDKTKKAWTHSAAAACGGHNTCLRGRHGEVISEDLRQYQQGRSFNIQPTRSD